MAIIQEQKVFCPPDEAAGYYCFGCEREKATGGD
jgi:hypothetical protein